MDTINPLPNSESSAESYSLAQLCLLADMPIRTVRYYIQIALVNRPAGGTRAARYDSEHLQQLLLIKKWTQAGLALDRIRDILHGQISDALFVTARGSAMTFTQSCESTTEKSYACPSLGERQDSRRSWKMCASATCVSPWQNDTRSAYTPLTTSTTSSTAKAARNTGLHMWQPVA